MDNLENQSSGVVEKINLSDLKIEQAKIKFEENANKIINNPELTKNAFKYLKQHSEEYKEIYGHDLTIIE